MNAARYSSSLEFKGWMLLSTYEKLKREGWSFEHAERGQFMAPSGEDLVWHIGLVRSPFKDDRELHQFLLDLFYRDQHEIGSARPIVQQTETEAK